MFTTSKQNSPLSLLDLPVEVNILIVCHLPLPTLDLLLAAHPYFRELWKINVENKRGRDQRLRLTRREHVDQLIAAAQFDPFYFSKAMLACSICLKLRYVENFRRPLWGTAKQMRKRACIDCQGEQPSPILIRSLASGAGWCHQSGIGIARTFGSRCQGCDKSVCTRVPGMPLLWMHCLSHAGRSIDVDQYNVREQRTSFSARWQQPQEDCFQAREFEREIEVEIAKRQRAVFDEERLKRFWNRPAETVDYGEERATWREKAMYLWSVDQEYVLDRRFLYTKPLKNAIKFEGSLSSMFTNKHQDHRDRLKQAYAATSDGAPQYRWPCRLLANSFGQGSEEDQGSRKKVATQYLRTYRTLIYENEFSGGFHCHYSGWRWWKVGMKLEKDIRRLLRSDFDLLKKRKK
ncbi:hypothetical protein MMC17_008055 [Xylographa soralifera]|nr:hypothetical protein [Xylographa soralifera]